MQTHEFEAGGRARRLIRADSKDNWWIRFIVRGKSIRRSLGTPDTKIAVKKAKSFIELEINGKPEEARKLKVRSEYPTLLQIAEKFIEKFATDAARRTTALGYVNALARMVRVVTGRKVEKTVGKRDSWKQLLADVRAGILTSQFVLDYQAKKE